MSVAFDLNLELPDAPARPASYVADEDWTAFVQNVGGAVRGGVSMTALSYNTGHGYHFTLQAEFADPTQRKIVQPHITIDGTTTSYYHTLPGATLPAHARASNATSPTAFSAMGLDCAALLTNFVNAATAKIDAFNASSQYRAAVNAYRRRWPWAQIVAVWQARALRDHTDLVITQRRPGGLSALLDRGSAGQPFVVDVSKDLATVGEPPNAANHSFEYLDRTYRVISRDGALVGVILQTKLESKRTAAYGKNSPERLLQQQIQWSQEIRRRIPEAVEASLGAARIEGAASGRMLVFRLGGSVKQADTAWTGASGRSVQVRAAFEERVARRVDEGMSTWTPSAEPDANAFLAQATSAVTESANDCSLVRVDGTDWVVPTRAVVNATSENRIGSLPRLQVVAAYSPGGRDTGRVIVRALADNTHFHAPPADLKPAKVDADYAGTDLYLLSNKSGSKGEQIREPADRVPLDYARYMWVETLPEATIAACGSSTLAMLPSGECVYVYDEMSHYQAGGNLFVPTGTADALRLRTRGGDEPVVIEPNTSAKVRTVEPKFVLPGGGDCILTNAEQQYVFCAKTSLAAVPPAFTADVVAVQIGTEILGFADLTTAPALEARHLIDCGALPAKVSVDFDKTLSRFIRQNPESGSLQCYDFVAYLRPPMKTDTAGLQEFLLKVVEAPSTVAIVDGTGDFAGNEIAVSQGPEHALTQATVLHWLTAGAGETECIVQYTGGGDWDDCACVTVVPEFANTGCDLIVRDGDAFQGYANSRTALHAQAAVMTGTPAYPGGGVYSQVRACPLASGKPQPADLAPTHVVSPPGTAPDTPHPAVAVEADPTLQEYLDHLSRGGLWYACTRGDGQRVLCAPAEPAQEVLVVPDGMSVEDAARHALGDA